MNTVYLLWYADRVAYPDMDPELIGVYGSWPLVRNALEALEPDPHKKFEKYWMEDREVIVEN